MFIGTYIFAATKVEYAKFSNTEGMSKIYEKYEIAKISLSTLTNIESDETYLMPVFMKGHIQHAPLSKVNTEQQSKPVSQKRLLKKKYIIFLALAPLFVPIHNPAQLAIRSLSNDVYERCTSTGSGPFSSLDDGFAQIFNQIVSITVKKLSNTNFISSRHIKREKSSLPVDVCRSKTSLLKLPSE